MFYAFRMGHDSLSATDQDVKLVSSIVEKVVVSKLTCEYKCDIKVHLHWTKAIFFFDLSRCLI